MMERLRQAWESMRSSLWFTPSVIVVGAVALAFLMVALDRQVGAEVAATWPLVFDAGPEGARLVLSSIASSVLTVAGVSFSITIVAFSLASTQYSPRTLRNFMDDRTNQIVLGMLLATFVYCLLVLRTVQTGDADFVSSLFVPVLSVTVAILLALVDLGLVILFIHHIAESIQAHTIIQRIADDTLRAVDKLYPEQIGKGAEEVEEEEPPAAPEPIRQVKAAGPGYVRRVNGDRLVEITEQHDLLITTKKRVGNYVTDEETLVLASPAARVTDKVCDHIRDTFEVGAYRTVQQDAEYGLLQLSDIAVKALSPSINDPTTAIICLDRIGSILRKAVGRKFPDRVRRDASGKARVIADGPTFESMAAQAFDQIRRYGASDPTIVTKMLDVLEEIAEATEVEARLRVLRKHAMAIVEDARRDISSSRDRDLVSARARSHLALLDAEVDRSWLSKSR